MAKFVFILSVLFSSAFCGIGCGEKDVQMPRVVVVDTIPIIPPPDTSKLVTKNYSYLALGDSYTIGTSVPESDRFPVQLTKLLAPKGIVFSDAAIIAANGWTTENLLSAIASRNDSKRYDIVTLLIGVNNQYQRRDTLGYRTQFALCLQKAIELAGGKKNRVFVLSIPDYSVTPFGGGSQTIAEQIAQYNAINFNVTTSYNVSYTNITPISQQAGNNAAFLAVDKLHPSGIQYALWVDLLAPKIEAALK